MIGLGRWGSRAPFPPTDADLGVDSFVIALKTLFDAEAAEGLDATFELGLGEDRFRCRVRDGSFEVARGSAEAPDATISTDPATLSSVLWHQRLLAEAERSGDLVIEGSRPPRRACSASSRRRSRPRRSHATRSGSSSRSAVRRAVSRAQPVVVR